ncbi:protein of unknown function [Hyphomicrobium sp. MC1]|nr:protein of unknown function [Hyphomicrobium sp. MC1]
MSFSIHTQNLGSAIRVPKEVAH